MGSFKKLNTRNSYVQFFRSTTWRKTSPKPAIYAKNFDYFVIFGSHILQMHNRISSYQNIIKPFLHFLGSLSYFLKVFLISKCVFSTFSKIFNFSHNRYFLDQRRYLNLFVVYSFASKLQSTKMWLYDAICFFIQTRIPNTFFFGRGGVDHGGTSSFRGDQGDQEKSGKKKSRFKKLMLKFISFSINFHLYWPL